MAAVDIIVRRNTEKKVFKHSIVPEGVDPYFIPPYIGIAVTAKGARFERENGSPDVVKGKEFPRSKSSEIGYEIKLANRRNSIMIDFCGRLMW